MSRSIVIGNPLPSSFLVARYFKNPWLKLAERTRALVSHIDTSRNYGQLYLVHPRLKRWWRGTYRQRGEFLSTFGVAEGPVDQAVQLGEHQPIGRSLLRLNRYDGDLRVWWRAKDETAL